MTEPALRAPVRSLAMTYSTLAIVVAITLAACDQGYRYRPRGWEPVGQSGTTWRVSMADIVLEHGGIGGLVISKDISPELAIRNESTRTFVLDRAELLTAAGRQLGTLPGDGGTEWRTVKPGTTQRITLGWSFSQPAREMLGASPEMVLEFRLDDQPERLVITYERVP